MDRLVAQAPLDDDGATIETEALLEDRDASAQSSEAKILSLLHTVLQRHPRNLMANHLCIHAYETQTDRTPALACADRLSAMRFAPQDEHLAHMPAHAYVENGAYAKAEAASERAWQLRLAWNAAIPPYQLEYAAHDADVGYETAMMLGDEQVAQTWGTRLGEQLQRSMQATTFARFAQWSYIAGLPAPSDAAQRFALGLADAHNGNLDAAAQQLAAVQKASPNSDLVQLLQAAIEERRGHIDAAASALQRAIAIQKRDLTAEFLPFFPAGEALAALYDRAGRYFDARTAAENALGSYPNDPRALYALLYACGHIGDGPCTTTTSEDFGAVWKSAPPNIADF